MQLAVRPYVTTGIAIVGASVIAVAPIVPAPTAVQIPNPVTQLERGVQLTVNEIEDAFNQLAFVGAQAAVTLAQLPAPLVAQLLGIPQPAAELLLAGAALGLSGPLIGGIGSGGAAVQDVVDQLGGGDIAALINALIGAPATLIDGVVNGGFGPNVGTLLGFPDFINVLVGGLINPGGLDLSGIILPGAIPTVQALITQLIGALGGGGIMAAGATPLALPVGTEGQIEAAVNALVFNLVASPIVTVAGLLGSLLAPVLGEEVAAGLPLAALGLFGPLISGTGAGGTALQDIVDSLGSGDFAGILSTLVGAPATLIDGVVNGGYGPDLSPLVADQVAGVLSEALGVPIPAEAIGTVVSGGLINEFDLLNALPIPPLNVKLPGTFPTLQGLVTQILGALPGAQALSAAAPAQTLSVNSVDTVDTSNKKLVTLDVGQAPTGLPSDAKVPPKVEEIKTAVDAGPGPDLGKTVSELARPDTAPMPPAGARTLDMTQGGKVIPETTAGDSDKNGGGSNPIGATLSTVANGLAGAVKSALGGGSAKGGDE